MSSGIGTQAWRECEASSRKVWGKREDRDTFLPSCLPSRFLRVCSHPSWNVKEITPTLQTHPSSPSHSFFGARTAAKEIRTLWELDESLSSPLNPRHPIINMHILLTVLHTLPKVLTRRICVTIKSWWSLPLLSWPQSVIQHCYCKEKLVVSHTQGLKDYQLDQITNGPQLHAGVSFFLSVTDQTISKSAAQWNIIFKPYPSCCKWGLSVLHSSQEKKALKETVS